MTWEQFFTALIGAIPGIGAAVLAVWRSYAKQRDESAARKKVSEDGHKETQRLINDVVAALQAENAAMRAERDAAIFDRDAMRAERDAANKKITRLSAQVELLKNQSK